MSVSRRASFAAGIAAARRNNHSSGGSGRGGPGPARGTPPGDSSGPDSATTANTITVVAGCPQDQHGHGYGPAATKTPQTPPSDPTAPHQDQDLAAAATAAQLMDAAAGKGGGAAFGLAAVAKAATVAAKKPRIQYEVRPFTRESLEKINIRTNNLIRDYGFLPKRSPNLQDGAQLPAKFEPFPAELLGKPVEELDQYVYEKVRRTARRNTKEALQSRVCTIRGPLLNTSCLLIPLFPSCIDSKGI